MALTNYRVHCDEMLEAFEQDDGTELRITAKAYPLVPVPHRAFAAAVFLKAKHGISFRDIVPADVSRLQDSGAVHRVIRSYVLRLNDSFGKARSEEWDKRQRQTMWLVLRGMRPSAIRVLGMWPPEVSPRMPGLGPFDSDEAVNLRREVIDRAVRSAGRYRRMLAVWTGKEGEGQPHA